MMLGLFSICFLSRPEVSLHLYEAYFMEHEREQRVKRTQRDYSCKRPLNTPSEFIL